MREIMFRGKMDDGEWVYGWPFADTADCSIKKVGKCECPHDGSKYFIVEWVDDLHEYEEREVTPDTVGQYTGMKDKNGKRIFEGDMIKPFDDEVDKMVVEFHNGQFLLCLYGERGYMAEYGWEEEGNYGCFEAEPLSSYGDDIEVIDNIHDNPELLEEDKQ